MSRTVTKLMESINASKSEKNPGRKFVALFNATVAVLFALRQTSGAPKRLSEALSNPQVSSTLSAFLKVCESKKRSLCMSSDEFLSRMHWSMEMSFFVKLLMKLSEGYVVWQGPLS